MAKRIRKITSSFLKKVIMQEARKLQNEAVTPGVLTPTKKVKAEEVDADEFAGSLEKDLDHVKALKIQELRLVKQIKKIREARAKLRKRITRKI